MSNSPKFTDSLHSNNAKNLAIMNSFRNNDVRELLIKWERETDDGYKSRQLNSVLYNVVEKTINTAKGMLFRKPLNWSDDLNKLFVQIASEDVDRNSTSLSEFAKEATVNSLWDGISFIIVDFPKIENGEAIVSFQQQLDSKLTPYFSHVKYSQILNRRMSGEKLTQITIDENIVEEDGEFGEKTVNQQRVLLIGGGKIYRENEVYYEWKNNLDYIPIVPVYSNKTGFLQGTPKFLPLAKLNLKHYNFLSQLDKSLFVAANPIPVIYGTQNKEEGGQVVIGVDTAITFTDKENSGFEWVEFAGTSIDKLQEEIKNIEMRMTSSGLSFLTSDNKDRTATEAAIVSSSETSDLSAIATSIQWAINQAYRIWCDMMNQDAKGEITSNRDFVGALSAEQAKVYLQMQKDGQITLDQLWTELERREFIQEFDRELAKAEIEAKNQSMAGIS